MNGTSNPNPNPNSVKSEKWFFKEQFERFQILKKELNCRYFENLAIVLRAFAMALKVLCRSVRRAEAGDCLFEGDRKRAPGLKSMNSGPVVEALRASEWATVDSGSGDDVLGICFFPAMAEAPVGMKLLTVKILFQSVSSSGGLALQQQLQFVKWFRR